MALCHSPREKTVSDSHPAVGMNATQSAVLDALADGPISGPDLAKQLDISRTAVWKQIEALRAEGFEISGDNGYELRSIPEFGGAAIEFGLDAPLNIECHASIESTNARARELAQQGQTNVAVVADEQTGGRGRLDREWHSPSGGIWLSILFRPEMPAVHAPVYTLAGAVATTRAVRTVGCEATIKWPNDVHVEGNKLAGILTEMEGEADKISWIVVGIGINANVDPDTLPTDHPATSLRAENGAVNRRRLTQDLLAEFWTLSKNTDTVLPGWRALNSTIGNRVRVSTPTEEITGDAVGIEYPGTLRVETETETIEVNAGDCEHLRPTDS